MYGTARINKQTNERTNKRKNDDQIKKKLDQNLSATTNLLQIRNANHHHRHCHDELKRTRARSLQDEIVSFFGVLFTLP